MVVVTMATLALVNWPAIVLNTLCVAAILIILMLHGVLNVIGLDISAIRVFRLCVRLVKVHFTPLAERPARNCIGLSGLRAGLVAMSMVSFPSGSLLLG